MWSINKTPSVASTTVGSFVSSMIRTTCGQWPFLKGTNNSPAGGAALTSWMNRVTPASSSKGAASMAIDMPSRFWILSISAA